VALAVLRGMRPHQWVKNVLVLVPAVLAHRIGEIAVWIDGLLAFAILGLAASAGYLANDVRDRDHDRAHPRKRNRPVAAGDLAPGVATTAAVVLLVAAFAAAIATLPVVFGVTLAVYVAGSVAYSVALKRVAVLDVLVLAGLYAVRLAAGGAATGVVLSPWLLVFAMFVFVSLAVAKRHAELAAVEDRDGTHAPGRGYRVEDRDVLRIVGLATGCVSVLVIALYVLSDEVRALYSHPNVLLLVGPPLLYWILRLWLLADRGALHDDPLVFTLRDRVAWIAGAVVAAVLWFAT